MLFIILSYNSFSQELNDSKAEVNDSTSTTTLKLNRWSIDIAFGSSRGIRPYNEGYFSTENEKWLGEINFNSINFGARYYINKYVTFKSDLAFDRFTPANGNSLDFDVAQFRFSIQSMFNLNSVFGINDTSRFKLPIHLGLNISSLKTIKSSENQTIGSPDYIIGAIYGLSPMYNINKKTAVFIDLSIITNFRQHKTWDGNVSEEKNNLTGQMSNLSVGISYKLGNPIVNVPADEIKKLQEASNDDLEKRLTDVETKLNDIDKDGVPDFLDQENDSMEGAVVDNKGVMVDKNKNNIPDEIEKYLEKSNKGNSNVTTTSQLPNDDIFKRAINQRYICVYFETNKSTYISSSNDSINYIFTFLSTNPEVKIDLIGYTDEIGGSDDNQKLGLDRANNVKETLMKLGIDSSRLNAISGGEDQTYNPSSQETRSLVRRVIFRVK